MKPNKTGDPCARCAEATPLAIGMRLGQQTPLCGPCQLQWFKERDEVVAAAFESFLLPRKRKKGV